MTADVGGERGLTAVVATGAGRPLRVFLVAGLGLGVWIMLRLPIVERDARAAGLPSPARQAGGVRPVSLAGAALAGNPVDVARAEVDVAAARLALAQAQLRLVQAQHGEGYRPQAYPALAHATAPGASQPPTYLPQPAYRGPPAHRHAAAIPDYGYRLPAGHRRATAAPELLGVSAPPAGGTALPPGHDLASRAYAALAAGDRREAVRLFDAALALPAGPVESPNRLAWSAERRRLVKRWTGSIYSLLRDGGAVGPTASTVLGGGQSGGILAWTANPLARAPVSIVARFNSANDRRGAPDGRTSQAAVGISWQPLKGVSITGERLFRIGTFARNDWNLRLAGGAEGKRGRIEWNAYGEAGVLGAGDVYAGAQARATLPLLVLPKARILAGAGAWGSVQNSAGYALGRFDVGPTLVMRTPLGSGVVDFSADYRFRLVGGALPTSGPALTVSTGF